MFNLLPIDLDIIHLVKNIIHRSSAVAARAYFILGKKVSKNFNTPTFTSYSSTPLSVNIAKMNVSTRINIKAPRRLLWALASLMASSSVLPSFLFLLRYSLMIYLSFWSSLFMNVYWNYFCLSYRCFFKTGSFFSFYISCSCYFLRASFSFSYLILLSLCSLIALSSLL